MINISELGGEELQRMLREVRSSQQLQVYDGDAITFAGVKLHGFFDAVCREEDGSSVWEVHKSNLLTDLGRRQFSYDSITQGSVFTSPNTDVVSPLRYSLFDSSGHCQQMAMTTPTVDWGSWSKSWSTTFAVPGFYRTIGCIGVLGQHTWLTTGGVSGILCYSLITPTKVQGPTQTLELSYRLTMQIGV
jgi:hypothetical protein